MRFNSYAAKLKKTKIAHKSWPIRKNYLRDPQKATQANHTNHAQKYNI